MSMFSKEIIMRLIKSDRSFLANAESIIEEIVDKMAFEGANHIESIGTGELIEYEEIEIALKVISCLLEERTDYTWKLV